MSSSEHNTVAAAHAAHVAASLRETEQAAQASSQAAAVHIAAKDDGLAAQPRTASQSAPPGGASERQQDSQRQAAEQRESPGSEVSSAATVTPKQQHAQAVGMAAAASPSPPAEAAAETEASGGETTMLDGRRETMNARFGLEAAKRTLETRAGSSRMTHSLSASSEQARPLVAAPASLRLSQSRPSSSGGSGGGGLAGSSSSSASPIWTRARTQAAAAKILASLSCEACGEAIDEPVTLPCGHSTCLSCLTARTSATRPALAAPCDSHIAPRLPICTMSVPCSVLGCPRSAIGRGLGSWAGHRAAFGPRGLLEEDSMEVASVGSCGGPGSPPVDGFVVAQPDHTLALSVIPAQRKGEKREYAVAPFDFDGAPTAAPINLRNDVTLTKALGVLRRFAVRSATPPTETAAMARRMHDRAAADNARRGRDVAAALSRSRRRGRHGPSSARIARSQRAPYHRAGAADDSSSDRRVAIAPNFLPMLGGSEAERESGSVGGVRATSETDEDEELEHDDDDDDDELASWHTVGEHAAYSEDEDERAEVGGAFARHAGAGGMSASFDDELDGGGASGNVARGRSGPSDSKRRRKRPLFGSARATQLLDAGESSEWDTESSMHGDADMHSAGTAPYSMAMLMSGGQPDVESLDQLHSELLDVLECQLCYLLLHEPLTTPCGHTFCRTCFARSLDHGSKCPLCRASLPKFSFFQDHPVNASLMKLLNSSYCEPSEVHVWQADVLESQRQRSKVDGGGASTTSMPTSTMPALMAPSMVVTPSTSKQVERATVHGVKALYAERKAAVEQEEREARLSSPIFVCTVGYPDMPTILHIFEPRYRLMIRRCVESGNPRFGMVLPSRDMSGPFPGMSEYGIMLEIKSVQMLPDGRSMIETVGSNRFRVLERGALDGYTVGRIEPIFDISPEEEAQLEQAAMERNAVREHVVQARAEAAARSSAEAPLTAEPLSRSASQSSNSAGSSAEGLPDFPSAPNAESLQLAAVGLPPLEPSEREPSTEEMIETCMSFIATLRAGTAPWLVTRLNHTYGPMPESHDASKISFWMALVMPIDEHEKARLLPIRSPRLRLRVVVYWIEQLRSMWWFDSGCNVQ